jgi:hypothetical protein
MSCNMSMCQQALKDAGFDLFPVTFAFQHAAAQHAHGCLHIREERPVCSRSTAVVKECADTLMQGPAASPSLTSLTMHQRAASPSRSHFAVHPPCCTLPPTGGPPGPEVVPASVPGPHPA